KNKFWSEVMGWGKFVICPSRVVARHMKENFGVPEEKIVIISRWVDLNKFKFSDYSQRQRSNTIVSVGRISPSKGYQYLIEGFKKVVRVNPFLKLQIIGSADKSKLKYYNYLKSLVNRFSLNHNVQFLGFWPDIENILKNARMLVAPSVIEESFGRVVIEAFGSGVPVIATKVGGFAEIIEHGKDGLLIEAASSSAIADAIIKILNEPAYAKSLVQNAYEKAVTRYTMQKCLIETEKVYRETLTLKRILVIKISSLGDLILSLPSLKALKEDSGNSQLSILTLKKYCPLLYGCPYLDEIITVDGNYKSIKNILNLSKDLRRKSFDYIIDFQNSRTSHLISCLSLPKESFGYRLRWGRLLTKSIKYNRNDSPLVSQERILQFLGVKFKEKKLIFWDKPDESKITLPDGNLIGINISASLRWESKRWPAKHIVNLIELINKNLPSYKVVLIGDNAAKRLAQMIENSLNGHLINLCSKTTLANLASVIKKLSIFITPDTATLHLASCLNIPTIALFGPTDPKRHTVESKNLYIFCKNLECSFCYKPQCKLKESNVCMQKITPQEVFTKIKEIIKKPCEY
ncbi:MAG: glycosyltransferase, partial [Candidatus Omnitrophota bacterium]